MVGRKKYFGNNIEPACSYCKCGKLSYDKTMILCEKTGVVEHDYSCKKFCYDPLKRVPTPPPMLQKHTSEEFEL